MKKKQPKKKQEKPDKLNRNSHIIQKKKKREVIDIAYRNINYCKGFNYFVGCCLFMP